jgi:hypothetical protein
MEARSKYREPSIKETRFREAMQKKAGEEKVVLMEVWWR